MEDEDVGSSAGGVGEVGVSSGFAIRRPPSAWVRLRSPLMVGSSCNEARTKQQRAGNVVETVLQAAE
jgi:hypothetical protein